MASNDSCSSSAGRSFCFRGKSGFREGGHNEQRAGGASGSLRGFGSSHQIIDISIALRLAATLTDVHAQRKAKKHLVCGRTNCSRPRPASRYPWPDSKRLERQAKGATKRTFGVGPPAGGVRSAISRLVPHSKGLPGPGFVYLQLCLMHMQIHIYIHTRNSLAGG